jgi:hypothetical protein
MRNAQSRDAEGRRCAAIGPSSTVEPPWWGDFISECYPDAKIRGFSQIQKFHPDVVKQGFEWASSRTISAV